uniref:Peptidase M12A domain-containing protein n=2 Tax=Tetranychus urticae TaxID=32264 RepID=T1K2V1_TETUR
MEPGSLWPRRVIIPYEIDPALDPHRATILAAMNEISGTTCIKFRPRYNQSRYLNIKSSQNCDVVVGSVAGGTPLNLSNKCVCKGVVMHGLFHAVGVPKPGDKGPNHENLYPFVRLTYEINNPQLCTKNVLNQAEINSLKKTYKC